MRKWMASRTLEHGTPKEREAYARHEARNTSPEEYAQDSHKEYARNGGRSVYSPSHS